MRSPWRTVQQLDPTRNYVALMTDIPPKRLSSTRRWFRGASAVKAQLPAADGMVGFMLAAAPLRKRYRTLSVWTDEEAMARFAHGGAHGRLVRELEPEFAHSRFVRWTFAGHEGRPRWRDALRRLDQKPVRHPTHDRS